MLLPRSYCASDVDLFVGCAWCGGDVWSRSWVGCGEWAVGIGCWEWGSGCFDGSAFFYCFGDDLLMVLELLNVEGVCAERYVERAASCMLASRRAMTKKFEYVLDITCRCINIFQFLNYVRDIAAIPIKQS